MNPTGTAPLVSLSFVRMAKPQFTSGQKVIQIIAKLRHKRRSTSGQLVQHHASRWTNTSVVEKPVRFRTSANSHFPLGTQKRSKARKKKATSPTVTQVQRRLSKVSPYLTGQQTAIVGMALHSPGRSPTTTA